MSQLQILKLNCISCNGNLEISPDTNKFACGYCGIQQIVERKGGIVQLKEVIDAISKVQTGTDKTAAELAIKRLKSELNSLQLEFKDKESNWNLKLEPFQRELAKTNIYKESSNNLLGCFLFIICFTITLIISSIIGALIGIGLKVIFTLSKESYQTIFSAISLIGGIPIFIVIYPWLKKLSNKQDSNQPPSRIDNLTAEIISLENKRDLELNKISLEIQNIQRKITLNKQIVDI